ncbi:MAG: Protein kinase [Myxococcales bacterium]|nr:Protein kinase [Myxococcales bacterium]
MWKPEEAAPTHLGSYEIVRKLARGGMADLFLARTTTHTFERLVVLKKILPKFAANPRYIQLFLDEATLAAGLNHKNIVQVFDIGQDRGESFFAMEFLHGQDVRTILHRTWRLREKVPIVHAIHIASQVAAALHFAHEKRRPDGSLMDIVHRDVSPSNIIVSYEGAVKLLDFGVAKTSRSTIKTRTGTLKGKISYMSPEQAKGASIDRRSDIFSLGIVLWEMITTTRLFRGENDLATLQLIINQPPRKPTEVNAECPRELERIVLRALSQDLATRYQTAQELALELEDLVRQLQLMQSSTTLGNYMAELFRHEIASWHQAQAAGVVLSEHLTKEIADAGDVTTPISESEFIEALDFAALEQQEDDDEDDDELDDLEEPETLRAVAGMIDPQIDPMRASKPQVRDSVPPALPRTITPRTMTPPPGMPMTAADASTRTVIVTPMGLRRLDATPLPSVMIGKLDPTGLARPEPVAWPATANPVALGYTPEQAYRLQRRVMWAGGALICLIIAIAIMKSAGGGHVSARQDPPSDRVAPAAAP